MNDDNGMGGSSTVDNGRAERVQRVKVRAREMKDTALSTVADTPGWVWAVIGGVVLLLVGVLAASKIRSRASHDIHES